MLLATLETSHGRGVRISEDGRHTLCASQSITALWQMLSAVKLYLYGSAVQERRLSWGLGCRFHYTMMAWLPTYFTDTLSLTLSQAAQVSLLPPIAAIGASLLAGILDLCACAMTGHGTPVAD